MRLHQQIHARAPVQIAFKAAKYFGSIPSVPGDYNTERPHRALGQQTPAA
jgi:transposase InsO family protein